MVFYYAFNLLCLFFLESFEAVVPPLFWYQWLSHPHRVMMMIIIIVSPNC